jgi:hypothetical protein
MIKLSEEAVSANPLTKRAAFTNPATHSLVLGLILLKEFGPEYLAWEPETVWTEVEKTWGTTVSEINKNKIQAVRLCYVQDTPYRAWEVFEDMAAALNGVIPRFDALQRPTAAHAAAALDMMQQIRETQLISDQIYRYCAAVLMDTGVVWGPGPLSPCNKYLTPMVGEALQNRVESAVSRGKVPTFDGTNEDDTQIMKSTTIKDYCDFMSQQLLHQMRQLMP